jgi:hypothetical protein
MLQGPLVIAVDTGIGNFCSCIKYRVEQKNVGLKILIKRRGNVTFRLDERLQRPVVELVMHNFGLLCTTLYNVKIHLMAFGLKPLKCRLCEISLLKKELKETIPFKADITRSDRACFTFAIKP